MLYFRYYIIPKNLCKFSQFVYNNAKILFLKIKGDKVQKYIPSIFIP